MLCSQEQRAHFALEGTIPLLEDIEGFALEGTSPLLEYIEGFLYTIKELATQISGKRRRETASVH